MISICGRDDKLWGYFGVARWLLWGYFVLASLCYFMWVFWVLFSFDTKDTKRHKRHKAINIKLMLVTLGLVCVSYFVLASLCDLA